MCIRDRRRTQVTDERGEYQFQQIPPGLYTVTVTAQGFGVQSKRAEFLVSQPASLNFKLSVQEATTTVDVLSEELTPVSYTHLDVYKRQISSRFQSARKLMGYCGVFPSEDSSGKRIRRGGITKSGNAHLRRIVVESAWSYRHLPRVGEKLRKRHQGIPAEIIEIAWKAQNRLHKRYMKLTMAGKDQRKVMTAVARASAVTLKPATCRCV